MLFSLALVFMTHLQTLDCCNNGLSVAGVHAFQPALRANRTLKELRLGGCSLYDGGLCLLAYALVGNTTMELLNICVNSIASAGLADDMTRLLELTQLKTIGF